MGEGYLERVSSLELGRYQLVFPLLGPLSSVMSIVLGDFVESSFWVPVAGPLFGKRCCRPSIMSSPSSNSSRRAACHWLPRCSVSRCHRANPLFCDRATSRRSGHRQFTWRYPQIPRNRNHVPLLAAMDESDRRRTRCRTEDVVIAGSQPRLMYDAFRLNRSSVR